jgi:phage I-like protein
MIAELRKENAGHRTKVKDAENERQRQEQQRLEASKEFEKLATSQKTELEQLRPKAERTEALEAYIKSSVETRVNALPADVRGLVPDYDDPLKTLAWLDANAQRLMPRSAPDLNAGVGGSGSGGGGSAAKLTPEEEKAARRMGIKPEEYAKYKTAKS